MKDLTAYKALGFNTFLIMGAINTYISAVMPVIRKVLSLSYSDVGVIYAANSIGFLTGALISGLLIDSIGSKKPLLFSFLLFPVGALSFALAQGAFSLFAGNLIIGFSISVMEISIPPISGRFRGKSGSLLNLIHAFFALGSMLSPFVASYFISRDLPYRAFFFVIAGYTCIPFFFSNILKIHMPERKKEERKNALSGVGFTLKNKYFWLICCAIFFYVGSEIGVFSWAPIYSTDKMQNSEELSSLLPSMFWIGLLIGRFLSAKWVDKVGHLKWLMLVTLIGLPITFLAQNPVNSYLFLSIFISLSGFMHSSIFPTLQSLLVETIDKGLGFSLSLFSAFASLGSLTAGFVIGKISSAFGIQWGYLFPFFLFSGTFVMVLIITLLRKKEEGKA